MNSIALFDHGGNNMPVEKTAIVFFEHAEALHFFVVEGDHSHLNNVYIRGTRTLEYQQQLEHLLFDEKYEFRHKEASTEEVAKAICAGAAFIHTGQYK